MTPLIKLYTKTFLFILISYGLTMYFGKLFIGSKIQFNSFFLQIFSFGLMMSLFFVYLHASSLKEIGIDTFTDKNLSTKQSKEIKINISKNEIIEKIQNDRKTRKFVINESENTIQLITKSSNSIFGEKVTIDFNNLEKDEEIQISSYPYFRFKLLDFGDNLKNIIHFEKLFKVQS